MQTPNPDKRTHCGACRVRLDTKGIPESKDYGGDCMACMALVGDRSAGKALAALERRRERARKTAAPA